MVCMVLLALSDITADTSVVLTQLTYGTAIACGE